MNVKGGRGVTADAENIILNNLVSALFGILYEARTSLYV
jgi:hypothetical protein